MVQAVTKTLAGQAPATQLREVIRRPISQLQRSDRTYDDNLCTDGLKTARRFRNGQRWQRLYRFAVCQYVGRPAKHVINIRDPMARQQCFSSSCLLYSAFRHWSLSYGLRLGRAVPDRQTASVGSNNSTRQQPANCPPTVYKSTCAGYPSSGYAKTQLKTTVTVAKPVSTFTLTHFFREQVAFVATIV